MKIAIIGRTGALLASAQEVASKGHQIPLVWTTEKEAHYDIGADAFENLAKKLGAEFINSEKINSEDSVKRINDLDCEIAISLNWPTLIEKGLIDCFKFGILNSHLGDLPRFRGNACPNWAILSGEPHVGLCIHQMATELDTGPVILRDKFSLSNSTYIGDVYSWFESRLPSIFCEAIEGLASGSLTPKTQPTDPSLALRCYPRRSSDGRIDWNSSGETVTRLIRASSHPFDGAFSSFEKGRLIKIWKAEIVEHPGAFHAIPGQICYRIDGDPVIASSDSMVRLIEIELEDGTSGIEAKKMVGKSLRSRLM